MVKTKRNDQEDSERPFVKRFKQSLQDGEMTDLRVIAGDGSGVSVPAYRFALAVMSPVLKAMLFGSFQEATSSSVTLKDCNKRMLEILVEYSCIGELNTEAWWPKETSPSIALEETISMAKYAHSIETLDLRDLLIEYGSSLINQDLPLACIAFAQCDEETTPSLLELALKKIRASPHETLVNTYLWGGVGVISKEKMAELLQDKNIICEEIFMFKSLLAWKKCNQDKYPDMDEVCKGFQKYFDYTLFAPDDIEEFVQPSGFVSDSLVLKAVLRRARSSKGSWYGGYRCPSGTEMLLITDAENDRVNGCYLRDPDSIYFRQMGGGQAGGFHIVPAQLKWYIVPPFTFRKICDAEVVGDDDGYRKSVCSDSYVYCSQGAICSHPPMTGFHDRHHARSALKCAKVACHPAAKLSKEA